MALYRAPLLFFLPSPCSAFLPFLPFSFLFYFRSLLVWLFVFRIQLVHLRYVHIPQLQRTHSLHLRHPRTQSFQDVKTSKTSASNQRSPPLLCSSSFPEQKSTFQKTGKLTADEVRRLATAARNTVYLGGITLAFCSSAVTTLAHPDSLFCLFASALPSLYTSLILVVCVAVYLCVLLLVFLVSLVSSCLPLSAFLCVSVSVPTHR